MTDLIWVMIKTSNINDNWTKTQRLLIIFATIHVQGRCLMPVVSSENLYGWCCKFSESVHGVGFHTDNLSTYIFLSVTYINFCIDRNGLCGLKWNNHNDNTIRRAIISFFPGTYSKGQIKATALEIIKPFKFWISHLYYWKQWYTKISFLLWRILSENNKKLFKFLWLNWEKKSDLVSRLLWVESV